MLIISVKKWDADAECFYSVEAKNTPADRIYFRATRDEKNALGHHVQKIHILDALWGEAVNQPNNPDHDDFQQHRRRIGYLKRIY